ncbi:MAG: helix-turn-helix transcriptional regulator [Chloroflexi bacterium]|nr:helix-turn-helix transcriptional regulator [Chloroflexota bacterium]
MLAREAAMVAIRQESVPEPAAPLMWGFVQPAVLLLLTEGPRHGYALLEELRGRGYLPGDADVGNLYRGLRRLEAEGHVVSSWVRQEGPGPSRRIYRITTRGEGLLFQEALALAQRAGTTERLLSEYRRLYPKGPLGMRAA